jgi:hypothetical protein
MGWWGVYVTRGGSRPHVGRFEREHQAFGEAFKQRESNSWSTVPVM